MDKLGFIPKILTRPLGLAYLSSYVRSKGHECEILDLQTCPESKRIRTLKEKIKRNHYEFVGFTFFTYGYPEALKMAKLCKKDFPQIKILFGGPHASFTYEDILRYDFVDYVVVGEGERSLLGLISNEDVKNINGLACRNVGGVVLNPPREIDDINSIPLPDRERCTPIHFPYSPIDYIQTSRGCPKKCSFCVESRLFRKMRFRDPKNVVDEMKQLTKEGKKILYLSDSNFSVSREHVESICREIRKSKLKIHLFAELSVEFTDKEVLKIMAESSFKSVAFGIESLTNQSLTEIDKTLEGNKYTEKAFDLLRYCNRIGLDCSSYYIVPLQHQTRESVLEEIKLLLSFGRVELMFLTPFPGTPLWEEADSHLRTRDFSKFDSYNVVYNPSKIPQKDLKRIYQFVVKQNRNHYARPQLG